MTTRSARTVLALQGGIVSTSKDEKDTGMTGLVALLKSAAVTVTLPCFQMRLVASLCG